MLKRNHVLKALFLITTVVLFGCVTPYVPTTPGYNLNLIGAVTTDSTDQNDVLAVFAVTPINEEDFRPVLSMKITYKVDGEEEKVVDLQRQTEKKVRVIIYGKNVQEKDPMIYQLVKDKVDLAGKKDLFLLAFSFNDISKNKVNKMNIRYGLWEKRNNSIRFEQDFNVDVQH